MKKSRINGMSRTTGPDVQKQADEIDELIVEFNQEVASA